MPRGCTTRARCGGACFNDAEHRETMNWLTYWDGLTEEGKERERRMMLAHAAECRARRY